MIIISQNILLTLWLLHHNVVAIIYIAISYDYTVANLLDELRH